MMVLGRIGAGAWKDQVRAWLAYLDEADLPWWQERRGWREVQAARERLGEGARPPEWLEVLVEEGMGRVARRVPFVAWGPGPPLEVRMSRRGAGLWPLRARLHKAIRRGEVGVVRAARPPAFQHWGPAERGQRWWLVVGRLRAWYALHGVSGVSIWVLEGEWWEGRGYGQHNYHTERRQ